MTEEMWAATRRFQSLVYGSRLFEEGVTDAELTQVTRELLLYMIDEALEVARDLPWKTHRLETGPVSKNNLLEELVDVLKFWMAVAAVWGFSPDDVEREFWRKTAVVEQRFAQERALAEWEGPVAVVDIDGVLADYPASFARFVFGSLGRELDDLSGRERVLWKHAYRDEGFEGSGADVRPGAREFLEQLDGRGVFVVALTSRPYSRYKRMFGDTLAWLEGNGLRVGAIVFEENKEAYLMRLLDAGKRVVLFVDDEEENRRKAEALGINVLRVDQMEDFTRVELGGGEVA